MDNYTKVDEDAFRTIDELLVSYNYRVKSIDYNYKHTIRCFNPQNLFGLEIYIDIALNCKDEELSTNSLKRYIEFHLRPYNLKNNSKANKNDKIELWKLCADRLTKYMADSHKIYLAYSTLFKEMQGRMVSLNIHDQT